jgi:hypothetical protein
LSQIITKLAAKAWFELCLYLRVQADYIDGVHMKKTLSALLMGLLAMGAMAQATQSLEGTILYESAGSPPFYLDKGDGSAPIPLSGAGAELFGNVGGEVTLTGTFDGGTFEVEEVVAGGGEELMGTWTLQVLIEGTWYNTTTLVMNADGSYTSVDLATGQVLEGTWSVFQSQLTMEDSDGLSTMTWSPFEEGVLKLVIDYAEDSSGNERDISGFPEVYMVPQ